MAVMQSRDGDGQTVVLQLPEDSKAAAPGDQPFASIDSIDYSNDGEVTVSGRAAPGAQLNVYIDNAFAGAVQADINGRWKFVPGTALALGDHMLRVDSTDEAGKVMARAET